MSGGVFKSITKHLNPIKNIESALKAKSASQFLKSSFVDPLNLGDKLKKIGGSITGTAAARAQAKAAQEEAANQEAQYQQTLQQTRNVNQLSGNDTANVATVTAGGTAQDSDDALSTSTKKNRQALISQTLGL